MVWRAAECDETRQEDGAYIWPSPHLRQSKTEEIAPLGSSRERPTVLAYPFKLGRIYLVEDCQKPPNSCVLSGRSDQRLARRRTVGERFEEPCKRRKW